VQDIAGRVIAEGLKPDETYMAKVITRNPVFVMSNSSAIEALQKMVQGFLVVYFYQLEISVSVVSFTIGHDHC
jgi:hypothetical protein